MHWLLGVVFFFVVLAFDYSFKVNTLLFALVVLAVLLWQQRSQLQQLRTLLDKLQLHLTQLEKQLQQPQQSSSLKSETITQKADVVAATTEPIKTPTTPSPSKPSIATNVSPNIDHLELPVIAPAAIELTKELPVTSSPTPTIYAQKPSQPNLFNQLWDAAFAWLTGGNTVVRVGIVILFFGLAFLLKYSAEHELIPLSLRYFAVGAGAIVLLALGWRWRHKRSDYALVLQGGAIATLYLLCFSALRLHQLLSPQLAMAILVFIGFSAAMLAVLQNTMTLALIGQAGGFLAPILASSGGGSHVHLFSYYVMLNAVILAIAVYKKWRPLNLTGFVFTFGIGSIWGGLSYQPEHYASTQPFLILFFVMYVLISILFARRNDSDNWRPFVPSRIDGSLVFGVPLVGFGLQYALVKDFEFGSAFSSLTLAGFYVAAAFAIKRFAALALLTESFVALAVVFASLAIPLALDAQWSSGSWAVEAAAIIWISLRQQQLWPRLFAYVLLAGACVLALGAHVQQAFVSTRHDALIFTDLLMSGGLLAAWQFLQRHHDRLRNAERHVRHIALALSLIWWTWAAMNIIDWYVDQQWQVAATAFTVSISMSLMMALQKLLDYRALFTHALARGWAWALLLAATVMAITRWQTIFYDQPFNGIVLFNGIVVAAHLLYAAWHAHHRNNHWLNRVLTHGPIWLAFFLLWRSSWLSLAPSAIVYTSATQLFVVLMLVATFVLIARQLKWPALSYLNIVLLPAATFILLQGSHRELVQPLAQRAWMVWPFLFAWQIWQLKCDAFVASTIQAIQHWWNALLLVLIVSWSASWWLTQHTDAGSAWVWLARLSIPALSLLLLTQRSWRLRWPLSAWRDCYDLAIAGTLIAAIVLQFSYSTIVSDGQSAPLPYWPLLNPLDIAHTISIVAIFLVIRGTSLADYLETQQQLRPVYVLIAAMIFVWSTCALLRAVHHYAHVPYQFNALWHAMAAQVALSLFWSALALTLMMLATRQALRWLWLCGAALMAIVVLKLFTVDLSQVGGLQRVLSFLGVGILMLVIGYLSPVPPKSAAQE